MDIANISSALSAVNASDPGSLASAVSLKMLDNSLSLTKMMENSVYPNLGGNIDVSV